MIITMQKDATKEELRNVVLHYLGSSSQINVMVGSPNGDGKYRVALNGLEVRHVKEPTGMPGVEYWTHDRKFFTEHFHLFEDAYLFYPNFGF